MYGFDISAEAREVHFYVVLNFGLDYKSELAKIAEDLRGLYPEYSFKLAPHVDISD